MAVQRVDQSGAEVQSFVGSEGRADPYAAWGAFAGTVADAATGAAAVLENQKAAAEEAAAGAVVSEFAQAQSSINEAAFSGDPVALSRERLRSWAVTEGLNASQQEVLLKAEEFHREAQRAIKAGKTGAYVDMVMKQRFSRLVADHPELRTELSGLLSSGSLEASTFNELEREADDEYARQKEVRDQAVAQTVKVLVDAGIPLAAFNTPDDAIQYAAQEIIPSLQRTAATNRRLQEIQADNNLSKAQREAEVEQLLRTGAPDMIKTQAITTMAIIGNPTSTPEQVATALTNWQVQRAQFRANLGHKAADPQVQAMFEPLDQMVTAVLNGEANAIAQLEQGTKLMQATAAYDLRATSPGLPYVEATIDAFGPIAGSPEFSNWMNGPGPRGEPSVRGLAVAALARASTTWQVGKMPTSQESDVYAPVLNESKEARQRRVAASKGLLQGLISNNNPTPEQLAVTGETLGMAFASAMAHGQDVSDGLQTVLSVVDQPAADRYLQTPEWQQAFDEHSAEFADLVATAEQRAIEQARRRGGRFAVSGNRLTFVPSGTNKPRFNARVPLSDVLPAYNRMLRLTTKTDTSISNEELLQATAEHLNAQLGVQATGSPATAGRGRNRVAR